MSEWSQEDIGAFLKVLDPEDNETGGGTASAVAGAMAAGLTGMVARLSAGREGMEPEEVYAEVDAAARLLAEGLFHGGEQDSAAFGAVMRAFRLPKESDQERLARSAAIQEAMIGAARVPLENAERCAKVLDLVARLEGRSNPNAAPDLAVARALATAALEGCLTNVEANLESIKDEGVRAELAGRAARLRSAALAAADGPPRGEEAGHA